MTNELMFLIFYKCFNTTQTAIQIWAKSGPDPEAIDNNVPKLCNNIVNSNL